MRRGLLLLILLAAVMLLASLTQPCAGPTGDEIISMRHIAETKSK